MLQVKVIMNFKFVRHCMGLAVGLGLFGGCARPSAQPNQPPTVSAVNPAPIVVAQAPAVPSAAPGPGLAGPQTSPAAPEAAPAAPANEDPAPKIEQRIPPTQPANVVTGVDEIAKLAQSGVSEEVILTYVDRYQARFNLSADQIVYLNDLGVSTTVVNAMLKHDGAEAPAATTPAPANPNVANAPMPVTPPTQTDVQVGGNAPIATAPATPSTEVAYFYDSLSPYGSWIYVSGSGWCWQPTVAVRVSTWQPYSDSGRWYWSDSGWYWQSDYSWGWAPFHYGRWSRHATAGWIWNPGTVWGPAWVSWRYSEGYCGWAPLPPAAVWVSGGGFSFHGRHVAVGFDFGLSYHHYSFVSVNRFCDPHPYRHRVPQTQVVNIYRNTTVVNNYRVNNGAIVNNGVGRDTIARRNPNDFRQVKVQQANFAGGGERNNRIEKRGNDLVVYRQQLPKDPPVKPAVVQSRMANQARVARVENNTPATGGAAVPRAGRSNIGEGGRGNATPTTPATPRANVGGNEPRNPGTGAQTPRVERDTRNSSTPGSSPQRIPQERNRSTEIQRNNNPNVARLNEAPATRNEAPATRSPQTPSATPRVQQNPQVAPRVQSPANVPSRNIERQAVPQARTPAVTAPSVPRSTPSMSPRYNEQNNVGGRVPSYAAPSHAAPSARSYSAPPAAAAPRVAAPESRQAPAARSGGAVERGSGGGGRGGDGGREGRNR